MASSGASVVTPGQLEEIIQDIGKKAVRDEGSGRGYMGAGLGFLIPVGIAVVAGLLLYLTGQRQ